MLKKSLIHSLKKTPQCFFQQRLLVSSDLFQTEKFYTKLSLLSLVFMTFNSKLLPPPLAFIHPYFQCKWKNNRYFSSVYHCIYKSNPIPFFLGLCQHDGPSQSSQCCSSLDILYFGSGLRLHNSAVQISNFPFVKLATSS